MVAAFILLVCLAPTMRVFTNIFKAQQQIIRDYQKDHIAHRFHAKFTENLYKREFSLEENQDIALSDSDLLKEINNAHFACKGTFKQAEQPHKVQGHLKYLYDLNLQVVDTLAQGKAAEPSIYHYKICIDTKSSENGENERESVDDEGEKDEE